MIILLSSISLSRIRTLAIWLKLLIIISSTPNGKRILITVSDLDFSFKKCRILWVSLLFKVLKLQNKIAISYFADFIISSIYHRYDSQPIGNLVSFLYLMDLLLEVHLWLLPTYCSHFLRHSLTFQVIGCYTLQSFCSIHE
jgi:hypothetical protein